jgi:hypothetical protein
VAKLLRATITTDPYPLAPRLKPLKAALAKLDPPPPASEPLPAPKPWTNSTIGPKEALAVTGVPSQAARLLWDKSPPRAIRCHRAP